MLKFNIFNPPPMPEPCAACPYKIRYDCYHVTGAKTKCREDGDTGCADCRCCCNTRAPMCAPGRLTEAELAAREFLLWMRREDALRENTLKRWVDADRKEDPSFADRVRDYKRWERSQPRGAKGGEYSISSPYADHGTRPLAGGRRRTRERASDRLYNATT